MGALLWDLEAFELVAVFTSGVRVALAGAFRVEVLGAALTSLAGFAFARGAGAAFALEVCARLLAGAAFAGARAFVGFEAATVALRAAVRRGVDRWGRVRGRLERTPTPASGVLGRPLLSFCVLIRTSLLKAHLASR